MSKNNRRHKRQKQGNNFPWLFVALGGVLLLAAAFLFANRSAGGDRSGTPSIAVDQQKIDSGYVKFGENKSFTIKVTNTGDGALRFKEKPYIEVLKGC